MPVKLSQSGSRILAALEKIAQHQSIGVSDLARALGTRLRSTPTAAAIFGDAHGPRWKSSGGVKILHTAAFSL